jgi:hypothetical protein
MYMVQEQELLRMKTEIAHLRAKAESMAAIDSSSQRATPARVPAPVPVAGEPIAHLSASSGNVAGDRARGTPNAQADSSSAQRSEPRGRPQEAAAMGRENGGRIGLLLLLESALSLVPPIISSCVALESTMGNLSSGSNAAAANVQKVQSQNSSMLTRAISTALYTTPSRALRSDSPALKTNVSSTEKATASSSISVKRGLTESPTWKGSEISALQSGGSRFSRPSLDQALPGMLSSKLNALLV